MTMNVGVNMSFSALIWSHDSFSNEGRDPKKFRFYEIFEEQFAKIPSTDSDPESGQ